eukprot:Nk52_evm8s2531 gene=Nk52_evmTU8s2531
MGTYHPGRDLITSVFCELIPRADFSEETDIKELESFLSDPRVLSVASFVGKPSPASPRLQCLDESRLRQVFSSMCVNGIQEWRRSGYPTAFVIFLNSGFFPKWGDENAQRVMSDDAQMDASALEDFMMESNDGDFDDWDVDDEEGVEDEEGGKSELVPFDLYPLLVYAASVSNIKRNLFSDGGFMEGSKNEVLRGQESVRSAWMIRCDENSLSSMIDKVLGCDENPMLFEVSDSEEYEDSNNEQSEDSDRRASVKLLKEKAWNEYREIHALDAENPLERKACDAFLNALPLYALSENCYSKFH